MVDRCEKCGKQMTDSYFWHNIDENRTYEICYACRNELKYGNKKMNAMEWIIIQVKDEIKKFVSKAV